MNGGGGDRQSPPLPSGEFLLQMLQRPPRQHHSQAPSHTLPHDPAVAAVGPSIPHRPIQSNGHDLTPKHPPLAPHAYMHGYSPNPNSKIQSSSPPLSDSFQNLGLHRINNHSFPNSGDEINGFFDPSKTHELNWKINRFADNFYNSTNTSRNPNSSDGDMRLNGYGNNFRNSPNSIGANNGILNGYRANYSTFPNSSDIGEGSNRATNGIEADYQNFPNLSRIGEGYNRKLNGFIVDRQKDSIFPNLPNYYRNQGQPPPGFMNKLKNGNFGHKLEKEKSSYNGSMNHGVKYEGEREKRNKGGVIGERRVNSQLNLAPLTGSSLNSVSGFEIEESLLELSSENGENFTIRGDLEEENGSSENNSKKKRDKDYRSDNRGQNVLAQWKRNTKRTIPCRRDIELLDGPLISIYESLVPSEEEEKKQKQLLTLLEKLVIDEWPEAKLLVYGSCANSFGLKKSDIDICLAMKNADVNKSEILLRLAAILKAENLENVQALTHARVPIVKLMDPITGISCDICINNVLAVVNSKLLRDYAKIDSRLRQLAFIVKHWAKLRGVNETYHGTLSSYAYVLMCIHYLQQCRPAILPCLQEMNTTYNVVIDNIECAFFDQVEKLSGFGLQNRENIGKLLWGFFRYWAYCHDYAHDVVSIRLGCTISKRDKDWTRRVGNDRHLICIEDPFETSHDLGRVVDRYSIKVLREEFERAAHILQFDPNPCVTLFEPYVP